MSHYAEIVPSGGDTGAPLNLRKRLDIIQRHVPIHGKKVIDCGCGTGQYVLALHELGADSYGIEYFENKVAEFIQNNPEEAPRVRAGNVEDMGFDDHSFDVALLNEALEHVPSEMKALSEVRRILKADGRLIVFSPNRFYPFETHGSHLKLGNVKLPLSTPFVPYLPLAVGNRVLRYNARNYWPGELRRLIAKHGFEITFTGYVWQTFENISGNQLRIVALLSPLLRALSGLLEKVPILRAFGVSQVVIATKS